MKHFAWLYEHTQKHDWMATLNGNFELTGVESPPQKCNFCPQKGELLKAWVPIRIRDIGANLWLVPSHWILTSWASDSFLNFFSFLPPISSSPHNSMRMTFEDLFLRLLFLVQTGIRVLGNTFLLSTYGSTSCTGHPLNPMHLTFTNMDGCGQLLGSSLQGDSPDDIYMGSDTHFG